MEVTLKNPPGSKHARNVDFHTATGEMGGAAISIVGPGQQTTFQFQALKEGVFVYHCAVCAICAVPPIPLHVTSGMYGAIIVLPKEGLPAVDKRLYLMEGDFYTEPSAEDSAKHVYSTDRSANENPSYVVINGRIDAVTGDNALIVKAGEKLSSTMGRPTLTRGPALSAVIWT